MTAARGTMTAAREIMITTTVAVGATRMPATTKAAVAALTILHREAQMRIRHQGTALTLVFVGRWKAMAAAIAAIESAKLQTAK
jgi:hypothetical protein